MHARLFIALLASAAYAAGACENLLTLKLEKATITSAQTVEAGAFAPPNGRAARGGNVFPKLPASCRVQATLTPTSDSHIEMELWMPFENWSGKFLAVGDGGWAGNIETGAMADAVLVSYSGFQSPSRRG
jgi:feruloyl esterase